MLRKNQGWALLLALSLLPACGQDVGGGGSEATDARAAATITSNQTGTDGGMFYSFWTNGQGSVSMTLDGSNGYSMQWSNVGDFTAGKGWNPGSAHTITYSGSYTNSGGGAFGIYGWTTNPLVEYYIVEAPGNAGSPGQGTQVGTVTSDGGTYTIWKHQQVNQPCITGNSCTFWQYISVRQTPRTSGTITIQNHFNAWAQNGMNLGAHNYQILLTESWNGSGSSSAKISEGGSSSSSSSSSSGGSSSGGSSSGATGCNGYVGITFDDGPSTGSTANLVNALKQNSLTPVTFFNIGQNVAGNPSLIPVELQVGTVQNHSYTHQHMTSWTQAQVQDELTRTNQAIQSAGAPQPTLFRLPYGESSPAIQAAATAVGLRAMTWDVDSQDWNNATTAAIVAANNQLQNGQVILMHEWPANTLAAIPQIAANLRARGLCPGRIDPATGRAVAPSGSSSGGSSSSSSSGGSSSGGSSSSSSSSGGSSSGGGTGACTATFSANAWNTGFTGTVTVKAGAAAINGWTVTLNMNGNTVTQVWSATNSGGVFKNVSYNGSVPAGGSTSFGFNGAFSGAFNAPTVVSCTSP